VTSSVPVAISSHDDVPAQEGAIIDQGLGDANEAAAPLHEVRRLSCFARSAAGEVIGGAVGRSWGECCELQQLWVHPAHRRQGLGAQLVLAFEEAGRVRGCRSFYLETFSFQAPAFYQSLGYTPVCELRGFGHGIVKYVMVKESS
jgi:GNAT superfamily N-acetyltransferase